MIYCVRLIAYTSNALNHWDY